MPVDSSDELYERLATRLRDFTNDDGAKIGTLCSNRVYFRQAPDDVAVPYLLLTVENGESDDEFLNLRAEFDLVASCIGARGAQKGLELIADLAEAALLSFRETGTSVGLTYGMRSARETEPLFTDPANKERSRVSVIVRMASWANHRTDALT